MTRGNGTRGGGEDEGFVCLVCQGTEGSHRLQKGELELWSCRACGFVQSHPVPTEAEVEAMYADEDEYALQLTRDEALFAGRDREVVRELAAAGAEGPFVDVGAGAGLLLRAACEVGWEAVGIELSEPNARIIREDLGVPVHVARLEEAPLAPGSVGVIAFSHSLEHLRDPVGTLKRARELLRPGGVVWVAVPNWGAATRHFVGAHLSWIHPHHIAYFERRTLGRAFRAAGLEPVRWDVRPFLGTNYPLAIAFARRLGLEPLFRRFLRLHDRSLDDLVRDDVVLECPPWRFRAVLALAHLSLRLWPERLFCALGRGQELRGTARRPA